MGYNTFFIADTHFGHANILNFKNDDDSPVRDFNSVEEMNEHMVERWNATINPKDRVYHLGDVVIQRRCLHILDRLNGRKKLVRGNHDIFKLKDYTPYFEDIYGVRVFNSGIIASHIPIHPDSKARFKANVHGHLHSRQVMDIKNRFVPDPWYICVSVENINYTPVSIEEILTLVH